MRASGIVFVGAEDEENLSIRSLGAFCEGAGIRSTIVGFNEEGDWRRVWGAVGRQKAAMLAASVPFQSEAAKAFEMLGRVRAAGFGGHIVVGGHFPTFEYRRILETQGAIDTVLRFEGEHGLVELYRAVVGGGELGRVPNLVYREGAGIRENGCVHAFMDLDALPFPMRMRRAQQLAGENYSSLISSRGCWHSSCTYCCIGAFHAAKGAKYALRSAGSVADEIALLHRTHGTRLFHFQDDNFVLGTPGETCERLGEMTREIRRRGLGRDEVVFLIKARPDVVEETVGDALVELGCIGAYVGVENASASGQRAMARGTDMPAVYRAMEVLRRREIPVTYNILVFHPRATLGEIRENVAFVRGHLDVPFDFARAEIVANSPLERLILREGLRYGTWPHWDYRLPDRLVQRAFDLYRVTFRAPGSPHLVLKEKLINLTYHAAVVRRLYGGGSAAALARAASELIVGVNGFVADRIEEMLDLAEVVPEVCSYEHLPAAVGAFKECLDVRCRGYVRQVMALGRELARLQTAERVFKGFGVGGTVQETPWLCGLFGIRRGVGRESATD